jgi:regulator of protease activity HflC (stomatin/prohibitin superfamily)
LLSVVCLLIGIAGIALAAAAHPGFAAAVVGILVGVCICLGLYQVDPNQARILMLFGQYKGTIKRNGLFWVNPFYSKTEISLKAQNLQGQVIKVNDKGGNPIEIAVVVVWQVEDTYRANFDVDNYITYVAVQSEAAVRHLAGMYPYDTFDESDNESLTLRGGGEQVRHVLEKELTERFHRAGIRVIEARISHLAYAPEIAETMLKRQQAMAVVAARSQIVNGAVSMVEMALQRLETKKTV